MATKKVAVNVPALGEKVLPLSVHKKEKKDGSTSLSYVLTLPDQSTGQGFRGFYAPIPTQPDSLPSVLTLTVGSGKSAEEVSVPLERKDLPQRTKKIRGKDVDLSPVSRTVGTQTFEANGDTYRLMAEFRVPPSGADRVKVKVTATRAAGGSGGTATAEVNPFA